MFIVSHAVIYNLVIKSGELTARSPRRFRETIYNVGKSKHVHVYTDFWHSRHISIVCDIMGDFQPEFPPEVYNKMLYCE